MLCFGFKVLMPCPECGGSVPLEGPALRVSCPACRSELELTQQNWQGVLEFRKYAAEFSLTEGKTRGSALTNGELKLLVRWGPQRPTCPGCSAPLAAEAVPPGSDGRLSCRCGQSLETFPVPAWLRQVVPTAAQLFGAAREGARGSATQLPSAAGHKPVLFSCPRCGAGLDVTSESPRILDCRYCQSDLYLPDPLWYALHPVRKRMPFWVGFLE